MVSSPILFAIVGCGNIAHRHVEQIQKIGKIVATCDIISERSKTLAEKYHARYFENIENLLEEVERLDVMVVCSPNGLHAEHTIKSLNRGLHVLCEKPMAINSKDCAEMIRVAEKADRYLFIVKQNRFNPPIVALKKMINEGRLGKIYSLQLNGFWNRSAEYYDEFWRGTLKLDGGILYTQFSHFIDLLFWLFGEVKHIRAMKSNFAHKQLIEFEDTCLVLMELESGALGTLNFTLNSYKKNMEGSLTIFAEMGTVKIGGQYLNELEYQEIEGYKLDGLPKGGIALNYGNYEGTMSNHNLVYKNLVEILRKGAPVSTNSYEGMKTVEIIERIYNAVDADYIRS